MSVTSDLKEPRSVLVGIGPMNAASQATSWAHASTSLGTRATSFAHDGRFARLLRPGPKVTIRADHSLPHYRLAPSVVRRTATRLAVRELTHVLNEGNVPFSSDPRTSSFAAEVRAGDYGRRPLGVVFHGSDARDPALAKEIDEASYFFDADPEWTRMVGERAARNRAEIAALGIPTFVTTPDMLAHVDGAELLPLSVDTHGWASGRPVMESAVPRVLHRGSGSKYTKGSKYILPALEALESAGRIELLTSPVLPHHAMAELIKSSDIVVDQVQTGTYGVTGVEAMAAGRLVVANISAHSGDVERPPIFHATPLGFTAAMEEILDSPDSARRVAERGPGYVDRVHNGQAAARVLRRFARET